MMISLDDLIIELASQCNKYVNGYCSTLKCLNRGGYKRGDTPREKPNYDISTCKYHEYIQEIKRLRAAER